LFEAFRKKHPDIICGLLHGDLSQTEKDEVMQSFYDGKISVLICTVVIEVGIDVTNASVMLIENAERFGLAQMHQLRGRVGRGPYESYCLLCSGEESEVSKERVKTLCSTNDGFVIAEKDLEIRGPGEFFGYRQHGLPQLVLADPVKHAEVAEKVGEEAKKLLKEDPTLSKPVNKAFSENIKKRYMNLDNLTI
jgi:ATP-dependent DNA helicase RecG